MASIQKLNSARTGKVAWKAVISINGYRRKSKTFKRKTDAQEWALKIENEMKEGNFLRTSQVTKKTLACLIDQYIKIELPKNEKKASKGTVKTQLLWWKDRIGHLLLAEVTSDVVAVNRDYLANEPLSKKLSRSDRNTRTPATVNHYLQNLSHCFNKAIKEWGWLKTNPVVNVEKLKKDRGRIRFLDDDERHRLLTEAKKSGNEHLYCMIVVSISIGCRKGELLNLKWKDVNFLRKTLTFEETKNGHVRTVPLASIAFDLLKEKAKKSMIPSELVFKSPNDPEKPIKFDNAWYKVLRDSEVENFKWHDLRHEAASQLAMSGASLVEISEILGHLTLSMVKRYAHLTERHLHDVVERMNNKVFR